MNLSTITNAILVTLAFSTVACGTAATKNVETAKVTYWQRPTTYNDRIVTMSEASFDEKRVRFVSVACKGDTGTGEWLPAGHEHETAPATENDATAWMLANTKLAPSGNTITVVEKCFSTAASIASTGIKRTFDPNEEPAVAAVAPKTE